MTDVTVNSTICGFVSEIHGELKGDKVVIDIDTPCEKVKQISHLEVPKMEVFDIKDNYVMDKAKEAKCCSTCLVPCAILHACKIESEFISKSLVKKSEPLSIELK